MSVPTDRNAPNETFCDGLHKLCRYLCDTYKDKDIIFLTPFKRKQPKGTSGGTWDCLDPHTDPSLFADTDGRAVHPNKDGNRIFADVLIKQMQKLRQ